MCFRPFSAMVVLFLAWPLAVRAADQASGFGLGATPAERELAEQPQPDGYFREMTGFWQGVPGLQALRARWEGFAGEDKGFAVLAALIPEAEGEPEKALEKLRGLPGSSARWNEGRLLALLGREQEAVAVLSALVTAAELPEMGASALIALTELDCIRGDFAKALQRTTAAWAARSEEGFRLRILERHLSLLVEAGREKAFLEEQVKAAESTGDEAAARTAQRVMAVMADWFTEDARLRAAREKLGSAHSTGVAMMMMGGRPGGTVLRETMECGILRPRGPALEVLGQDAAASMETAGSLAYQISWARQWPETLDGQPLLQQSFAAQPLLLSRMLFFNPDPAQPLPPLARKLADGMAAGVERRTVDLMERAWAGRAGPEDAETLASIIVESPQLRRQRPARPPAQGSSWATGWPVMPRFPTEQVIWNLSGKPWADFYRASCLMAPLSNQGSTVGFYGEETKVSAWSQWRPEWPSAQEASLTVWAWKHLMMLGEATRERAAGIARRMADPGDRFFFAAQCGRKELVAEWCRDAALLRRVNSTALMQAVQVLRNNGQDPPVEAEGEAALAIAREMARRMELNSLDLIRSLGIFSRNAPAGMKRDMQSRPVDPVLAETLGHLADSETEGVRGHWKARLPQTVPHPLFGLPVSPSVERFRVLAALLRIPRDYNRMSGFRTPLQQVVQGFFEGEGYFQGGTRPPELLRALETFPTAHPLKRQLPRWDALRVSFKLREESEQNRMGGFDRRGKEQDVNLKQALRTLAEEEQTSLSWHLVRAMLEENVAKRALLLDLVQSRSPLVAGVVLPVPTHQPGAADRATAVASASIRARSTPEALAAMFAKVIADPAARQQLEPAGALSEWKRRGVSAEAFLLSLNRAGVPAYTETAEHLMKLMDPLAVRMAVILIAQQSRPEMTASWLVRALAMFPNDPELHLAQAALDAQRGKATEAGRKAFHRGLVRLVRMTPFARDSRPVWCGIDENSIPQNAETVRALAVFAERSRPATFPQSWVRTMEAVLTNSTELAAMTETEVRSTLLAVVRYKTPWRSGQGSPKEWMPLLERLAQAGMKEAAGEAAETLLSQPAGSLGYPNGPAEPAPPWHNYSDGQVTGPNAEGWKLVQLASREDPAGLADRLQAVAAAHPGDEQTALAALLAKGSVRTLTADDVKMPGLSPAGRHRALAYASWLLTPDRLPAAMVLESWEAEAIVEFSDVRNGSRNFQQGTAYLDRLEKAGAADAVRRVLPALVDSVKRVGGLPEGYPGLIFRRLERMGTPALADQLHALLADLLKKLPEGPPSYETLAAALRAQVEQSGTANPPAELVRRVTLAFENTAADPIARDVANNSLAQVTYAAAEDPRWHGLLRQFLARQQAFPGKRPPVASILALQQFFDALDSPDLLPDLALDFRSTEPGKGVLHWKTRGPLPRKESGRENVLQDSTLEPKILWAKLAAGLAGKCDAVVVVEDPASGTTRVVARLERLPGDGEVMLENLPQIGRLRVQLFQREAPQATAELPPLGYNSFPVLIDTSKPPTAQIAPPEPWRLLADPIPLGATTQWYIDGSGPDSKSWPKGMHLILLDDANQVCASAPFSNESRSITMDTAGYHGVQLGLNRLAPTSPFSGTEARLRLVGPPRQLALAISLRQHYAGFDQENRGAASLTLREWPAPPVPSGQDRLEILGFWQLISDGENRTHPPAIADDTSLAAWFTPGKIFLHDLLKKDPPREIALGLPPQTRLDTFFWESGRLIIGYILTDADGSNRRYGFASVRPGDPVPVTLGDLPKDIRLSPSYHQGGGLGPVFLDSNGYICGVLDPAGKFLPLPPTESDTPPRGSLSSYQQLSATTYLCRQGNKGLYAVLDWTDGTLRISSVAEPPAPPIKPRRPWRTDGEGTTGDPAANPRTRWRHLLSVNDFRPISENLVVGIGTDGSLVLFRPIPAPETAVPLLPDE